MLLGESGAVVAPTVDGMLVHWLVGVWGLAFGDCLCVVGIPLHGLIISLPDTQLYRDKN